MKQQLVTMLALQDEMNTRVHAQWRTQGYQWYRAIWIESAELMDHYGWKWWKKQTLDRDQVELELIDIWHFGLSDLLQRESDLDVLAASIAKLMATQKQGGDFLEELEAFTLAVLQNKAFDVGQFAALLQCPSVNMSFARLFEGYVGKNVLNFFRQDHGYKDGSYLKVWSGREDNEHLVEAIEELQSGSADFRERLYDALALRYAGASAL